MPGLLGPTNPVPGYDPSPVKVQPPTPGDTSIQNIVDTTRVTRPDQRTDQQDNGDAAAAARYDSNFMTFLQRLRNAQSLPETFMRVLQWQSMISSGIQSGFASEMSQFLEFLRMDEAELLQFLQNQMQSSSRFAGALFDMLRQAYSGTQSGLLQSDILQFLRRYSDFSSTGHLEGKILRTVEEMTYSLPSKWANQVSDILAKLQNGVSAGDRAGNLALLREQLFTLLSRYVSLTHDHGRARGLLSMLTLDVARYENGSEDALLQSLRHLSSNGVLPKQLAELSDSELLQILRDTDYFKAAQDNSFADRLASLTNQALQGQGGANAQEAFHNILAALLINESVYMPIKHLMLPLDWNGKMMFSELWVDPDADHGTRDVSDGNGTLRILLKMDVESLGAFDVLINSRRENVSLQVACPKSVAAFTGEMAQALSGILTRNGLTVEQVSVQEMKRPLAVSEVFPKLLERMGGVNVKV